MSEQSTPRIADRLVGHDRGMIRDAPPSSFAPKWCCLSMVVQFVLMATIGSFNFGYSLAALNTSKAWISYSMKWCPSPDGKSANLDCKDNVVYGAILNAAVFLGAFFGCLVAGKLADFGRRSAMLVMHGFLILGALMSASAEGFISLVIARIVVGVGVGFSTVCVPMLIAEMTPSRTRGFFSVFHQLFITVGIFVATLLGLAFGQQPETSTEFFVPSDFQSAWTRVMMGLPIALCLPAVVLFLSVYTTETPYYLVGKGRVQTAEALLCEIYQTDNVSAHFDRILLSVKEAERVKDKSLSLWVTFTSPVYRRVILIGCILSIFQQFTGINVLMSNSNLLYKAAGLVKYNTQLTVGMTALNVAMTFPPILFVDRLGRRTLMLIGCTGQALCLAPAMIANLVDYKSTAAQYISVASTFGYVVFFAIGYGPMLWVYLHEIFPTEIKESAAALASGLNWLATIAMVMPSEFLLSDNPTVIFCIFTVMGLIALAFVFFFMKETKGLSIEDSPYFASATKSKSHLIQSVDEHDVVEKVKSQQRVSTNLG
eukprot:GHVS01059178.1.p1 GENE.GHVS01059178.1~~GHVS01059178.1.p1  ORF type:complete len:542 (+),score=45.75 GHVS01059178.1:165-1790(+)